MLSKLNLKSHPWYLQQLAQIDVAMTGLQLPFQLVSFIAAALQMWMFATEALALAWQDPRACVSSQQNPLGTTVNAKKGTRGTLSASHVMVRPATEGTVAAAAAAAFWCHTAACLTTTAAAITTHV